jgi:hypothetical protein
MIIQMQPPVTLGNVIEITVRVTPKVKAPLEYRYRFPRNQLGLFTDSSDPYLIANIFLAMYWGEDIHVAGRCSPSLLANLERFQEIWTCWRPDIYRKVKLTADEEREDTYSRNSSGISLFSGGIDAAFALLWHAKKDAGRCSVNPKVSLMVNGMGGFQHGAESLYKTAFNEAQLSTKPMNIPMGQVWTNWQYLQLQQGLNVYDIFPTGFISCLHMFRKGFSYGLFGSSDNTEHYKFEKAGSNPLTDPLLSSDGFKLIHEGSAFTRVEKIRYLAKWPEFLQTLRVCNQSHRTHRNCGNCEKCIRTALSFKVANVDFGDVLKMPTLDTITSMKITSDEVAVADASLLDEAEKIGMGDDAIFVALKKCLHNYYEGQRK